MSLRPESSTQEVLAGLVERVTFHNAENGFCVLRAKARGHRDLITVVGHAATIAAGEWITASGEWPGSAARTMCRHMPNCNLQAHIERPLQRKWPRYQAGPSWKGSTLGRDSNGRSSVRFPQPVRRTDRSHQPKQKGRSCREAATAPVRLISGHARPAAIRRRAGFLARFQAVQSSIHRRVASRRGILARGKWEILATAFVEGAFAVSYCRGPVSESSLVREAYPATCSETCPETYRETWSEMCPETC